MRAIVVAALIGLAAALTAPTAANAAACWQRVLEDWHDGQLDADYPVQCYRSAIAHLPEDLRVYGTAESDIQNAMARALARDHAAKRPARPAVHSATPAAAAATAQRTSTRAGKGTRRLVGRAATQPRVRLAAAPDESAADSAFPTVAVVAGAAALGGLLLVGAGARYAPRRRRPH